MTLNEIQPFGDSLIVRPDAVPTITEGGLHIPEVVNADNPNYFTVTGVVVKLGDGVRDDVYQCVNHQCRFECRRVPGERCPKCGAVQRLLRADSSRRPFDVQIGDRVHFGRFAGKELALDDGRVLLMREVEVVGIADASARIAHGYEAPKWGKITKGLTPTKVDIP